MFNSASLTSVLRGVRVPFGWSWFCSQILVQKQCLSTLLHDLFVHVLPIPWTAKFNSISDIFFILGVCMTQHLLREELGDIAGGLLRSWSAFNSGLMLIAQGMAGHLKV